MQISPCSPWTPDKNPTSTKSNPLLLLVSTASWVAEDQRTQESQLKSKIRIISIIQLPKDFCIKNKTDNPKSQNRIRNQRNPLLLHTTSEVFDNPVAKSFSNNNKKKTKISEILSKKAKKNNLITSATNDEARFSTSPYKTEGTPRMRQSRNGTT